MTERSEQQLARSNQRLQIGRSALSWQGSALQVDIDEWTAPWPQRLRGRLTLQPQALPGEAFELDAAGDHLWQPIAPLARAEVDMQSPALRWQGEAYIDHNRGSRPLAHDFQSWQWSRERAPGGEAARIVYDALARDGSARGLHLHIDATGQLTALPMPAPAALPPTAWRIPRHGHQLDGGTPSLLATLESGPFYARSLLQQPGGGVAMHESLSLDRFDSGWVQALLPFRMPRRA
jgi:carotenoid 1,2-hydratase